MIIAKLKIKKLRCLALLAIMLVLLSGCGSTEKDRLAAAVTEEVGGEDSSVNDGPAFKEGEEAALKKNKASSTEADEDASNEETDSEATDSKEPESATDREDEERELIRGDDNLMEIFAGNEIISLPDDMIAGQASVEDILQGNPIFYARVKTDGFAFEWVISDYEYEDNTFMEDGVLLISKEDDTKDTQAIHVQAAGGDPFPRVSLNDLFKYMDVNFDDVPDLLICTGHHGNQGLITYYCFLQTDTGFVEAPTFTEIRNPSVDTENKLILSQWRNSALSHSWAEYKCQDNTYTIDRVLTEDAESREDAGPDEDKYIWVWTVNKKEIGRSDQLSESEIADLLYNENSEWRLADDRWRTIHNAGMLIDFSIYSTP